MDNRDLVNYNRNRTETQISLVNNPIMDNRDLVNYNRNRTEIKNILVNIG
jgi:hypothetical protein